MAVYSIETPKGVLEIEHDGDPSELTGAVESWMSEQEKPKQTGTDMLKRIPAGIAKASADAGAGLLRMSEYVPISPVTEIAKAIPGGKEAIAGVRDYVAGLGDSAASSYGVDPKQNETIPSKIISGAASIVPAIASGPLAPATIAGMMGEQQYQEAADAGGTETQKNIALYGGAAVGALSEALLGVPALLRSAKAAGIPEATFKAISKEAAAQALKGAAREGTQEGVEQVAQNLIANKIAGYDKERGTFEGVPQAMALGAVVGGPVGAVMQTAASLDAISAQAQASSEQTVSEIASVAAAEPPPAIPEAPAPVTVDVTQNGVRTEEVFQPGDTTPSAVVETPAVQDIVPAIKVGDKIIQGEKGQTHQDIVTKYVDETGDVDALNDSLDPGNRLFMDPVGNTYTREQAKEKFGVAFSEDLREKQAAEKEEATFDRQDMVELMDRNSPGEALNYREIRKALGEERYVKRVIPISRLDKSDYGEENFVDPARATLSKGAIIVGPDGKIIDGRHRTAALAKQGEQTVEAYLPQSLANKWATAATTDTGQTPPIQQPPATAGEATVPAEGTAEAAPQQDVTLSAAQLEERIDTILSKHQASTDPAEQTRLWNEAKALMAEQMKAEGQSMGPGAASSAEALATYAERKFGIRFQDNPAIAKELKEAAGNRFYEVLPNKVTAQEATELIDRVGDDQAERMIRDDKSDTSFAVRSTVGQILIQRLNQQYKQLQETNPQEAQAVLNRAADLAEWQMDFGTRLGQGVQSFAMWMRLTPEGKLLGVKKAVKKARERHRQQNQTEVDQVLDTLNTDRTPEEKTQDMQRLGKKNRVARRVRKKLKQLTKEKQTAESFYDTAAADLGLPSLTPEQELELKDLADKVDLAPEGLPKWEAADKFTRAAQAIKGFTKRDLIFGYYYGNILSGAGTQIVNTVDTFFNVVNDVNTLAAANPKAAALIYGALGKGIANGKADAMLSLSKGRRISSNQIGESSGLMEQAKFGQKGGVPSLGPGKVAEMARAVLETKAGAPLNAWKYIGRLMGASDAVMFRGAQEARAALLAFRIATEEGLTSSQRTKRVNEIMGWDRVEEFMEKAKSEGYSGNEQAARATELMLQQRPEGMMQDASEFAGSSTYNERPRGPLGFISGIAQQIGNKYPAFRLIVPFTNIVANVFNRRLDNLPGVALYRARRGYYGSEEAGKNAIIRGHISLGMLTALGALAAQGVIEISGPGPEDPEKRRQLKESGWRPYSIKVGDTYYSYANTPIALGLGIMGNMIDWSKYQKPDQKKDQAFAEATVYSVFGLASYLVSQSFISGLANFMDIFGSSKGKANFAIRNFMSSTASAAVPMSALLKDIDSIYDDARKQSKTLGQAMLSQIPFARYFGKPALNAFGEPIKTGKIRPLMRFASTKTEDPAWSIVSEKQLRVPVPDPFFKTDDENYEYQKLSGQRTKQWILDNAETLRALPTEDAQDLLNESTTRIRKGIRGEMLFKAIQ